MTEQQNQIIKILNSFSCGISPYEIFSDWVKCCALALVNSATIFHGSVWQQREKEYVETLNKYKNVNAIDRFAEMLVLLAESLEVEINDALGEVLMHLDMGSKRLGQFFTPFHLSELVARLGNEKFIEGEIITVNEPTCGGGGNIIALAKVLKRRMIFMKYKEIEMNANEIMALQGIPRTGGIVDAISDVLFGRKIELDEDDLDDDNIEDET